MNVGSCWPMRIFNITLFVQMIHVYRSATKVVTTAEMDAHSQVVTGFYQTTKSFAFDRS